MSSESESFCTLFFLLFAFPIFVFLSFISVYLSSLEGVLALLDSFCIFRHVVEL